MARSLSGFFISLHWLAIALFMASRCPALLAQSSEPATTPDLAVVSAHYNRVLNTIKFKLLNNSRKSVTAYYVAFGVPGEKHPLWESGYGQDLLDHMLTSQCQDAGARARKRVDLWEGAIKPGDVYVNSEISNLPKNQLTAFNPPVQVAVVGVIWSDGSIETPTVAGESTGWVASSIQRRLALRRETAEVSARVVAILSAHPVEKGIHYHLGERIKALQSLMDDYHREQRDYSAFLVRRVIDDLSDLVASATPAVSFHTYRTNFECQYRHRLALMRASSAKPEQ
jgi:hypothetical protein